MKGKIMKKSIILMTFIVFTLGGCGSISNINNDDEIVRLKTKVQLLEEQIVEMNQKIVDLEDRVLDESLIEGVNLDNGKFLYTNLEAKITLVFNDMLPEDFQAYAHRSYIRIQYNDGINIEPSVLRFYLQDKRINKDNELFLEYDSKWDLHYAPAIGYFITDEEIIEIIEEFKCSLMVNDVQLYICP